VEKSSIKTNYQVVMVNELSLGKYQRTVKIQKVKAMAKEFDKTLLGTITISKRDGQLFVIDGQHRVVLARIKGLKELMALVYEGLTYEEEAEYFNKLNGANGEKLRLSKTEIFNASIEAKEDKSIEIKNIIEEFGFRISPASGINSVAAISTVEKIHKKHGGQHLRNTLRLLKETWNGETYSLNNLMISGVSEFLKIYSSEIDFNKKTFVSQLSKVDAKLIIRESKSDTSTDNSAVRTMNTLLKYYNKSLRSKRLENKHFNI